MKFAFYQNHEPNFYAQRNLNLSLITTFIIDMFFPILKLPFPRKTYFDVTGAFLGIKSRPTF